MFLTSPYLGQISQLQLKFKFGIANMNSLEKIWEAVICSVASLKIGETTK